MATFPARLYPPGSAEARRVVLMVSPGLLHVEDAAGARSSANLANVSLDVGGFTGRRALLWLRDSGETVICEELGLLDELKTAALGLALQEEIQRATSKLRSLPWRETKSWLMAAALLITIVAAVWLAVQWTVVLAADNLPVPLEEKVGELIWSSYKDDHEIDRNGGKLKRIRALGEKLVSRSQDRRYRVSFHVENNENINAFAIPGGQIVVMSGLIDGAGSDDEIACVLAHEIGHVLKRHSLRQAVHEAGLAAALTALAGDQSRQLATILSSAFALEKLNYSRAQEAEADSIGLALAWSAGYDPEAMISFFNRLESRYGQMLNNRALSLLSTHPMPSERIDGIRALSRKLKGTAVPRADPGGAVR